MPTSTLLNIDFPLLRFNTVMSSYEANLSRDGHTYTKRNGLVAGLHTYGVIKPERKVQQIDEDNVWEAVVIGAGYTGLIAARDLVKAGESESIATNAKEMSLIWSRQRYTFDRSPRPCGWPNLERGG